MTSPATSLQIGGIFILFIASFAGVTIPITAVNENMKGILALLNATSAGIMLGLALVRIFLFHRISVIQFTFD